MAHQLQNNQASFFQVSVSLLRRDALNLGFQGGGVNLYDVPGSYSQSTNPLSQGAETKSRSSKADSYFLSS